MNLKEIKELINLMNENELSEIEIEKENGKIRLKKNILEEKIQQVASGGNKQVNFQQEQIEEQKETGKSNIDKDNLEKIVAPMVGVFYRSSAPDAESFVEENDDIKDGQVLCIIEAMKVMNEIKSEVSGKIVEILVENGESVEYNQPLFLVEK